MDKLVHALLIATGVSSFPFFYFLIIQCVYNQPNLQLISFIAGYSMESLQILLIVFASGLVLTALVTVENDVPEYLINALYIGCYPSLASI